MHCNLYSALYADLCIYFLYLVCILLYFRNKKSLLTNKHELKKQTHLHNIKNVKTKSAISPKMITMRITITTMNTIVVPFDEEPKYNCTLHKQ